MKSQKSFLGNESLPRLMARLSIPSICSQLVTSILPVYFGAVWIFGIQRGAQRTFVAMGYAKKSIFIALLRKIILLIPLALILSQYAGAIGIFIAEPVASTVSAVASLVFLAQTYRKLKKTE